VSRIGSKIEAVPECEPTKLWHQPSLSIDTAEMEIHATSAKQPKTPRRMPGLINCLVRRVKPSSSSSSSRRTLRSVKSFPDDFVFHEENEAKPRRKGRSPASNTSSSSLLLENARLQQQTLQEHQESLSTVLDEATAVRTRTSEIESNLSELRNKTAALQKALENSVMQLERETTALQVTKEHLGRLDREAEQAMRALEETLRAWRMESTNGMHIISPDNGETPTMVSSRRPSLSPPLMLPEAQTTPLRARANRAPTARTLSTISKSWRENSKFFDFCCRL